MNNKGLSVQNIHEDKVNGANVTTMELENNSSKDLQVKITKEEDKTVYASYLDGEFTDKTIVYPNSNEMLFVDKYGNSKTLNMNDYAKTTENKRTESVKPKSSEDGIAQDSMSINSYSPPSSYSIYQSEYSSAWGAWGDLYGKVNLTYGPTQTIVFSTGTAVSTIIGVIGGIFTGGIGGILLALGATAVGSVIDSSIDGEVYSRTRKYDYEVVSQGELGLRTYTEDVDARVINSRTGSAEWVDLAERGDTRSRSDMIHAGIYNVAIGI
ncbi:hypothetical protein ACFSTA_01920 [Ornithinibacillus salinisoli]|uniref:Uncharacterized protein n=1 Tax=Ornithinibacillus salinisoli TaxID=1848459 RepID=A0ABW4VX17_9BACI